MAVKATSTLVRQLGGLNDSGAYNLFRVADDAALNTFIDAQIAVASAWLSLTAPTYYASTDASIDLVFKQAEAYITLQYLADALKARKVFGTHFPYDSEESSSYAQLIDVEWEARAETLLSRFVTLDTAANPIAFPYFGTSSVIDYTNVDSAEAELTEIRNQSLGYNPASAR